jgi:Ca2+-binding EF-hand superfamily protein
MCIQRHSDKDCSKRLSRKEFKQGVVAFGMTELSEKDLELLFQCFEKDENDTIDFDEFFRRLRPSLKQSRESTVNEAFDKMDVNKDGVIFIFVKTLEQ